MSMTFGICTHCSMFLCCIKGDMSAGGFRFMACAFFY